LVHVPGEMNKEADFLSRNIASVAKQAETIEEEAMEKNLMIDNRSKEKELDKRKEDHIEDYSREEAKEENEGKKMTKEEKTQALLNRHNQRHDGKLALIKFAKENGWKGKDVEEEAKKISKEC
ncbi:hypothetical protein ADUPG1_003558, partial [Aduncisulcus paluster]